MSRILVTSVGSVASSVIIEKLHKEKHYVVGTNMYPRKWIAETKMLDDFFQICNCCEDNYIDRLKEICVKAQIKYVFPLTDAEIDVLNEKREDFSNLGIVLCISPFNSIEICRNKKVASEIILKKRICNIPQIVSHFTGNRVIGKPINGRSSQGIVNIENKEEFAFYFEKKNYIFQNYIEGRIVTVDVLRHGDETVVLPRIELLRTVNGLGTTVKIIHDAKIEDITKKIAKAFNVIGCVNMEFILSPNNELFFLECNPRFSGGVKFSVMAGYDFINNHLKCFCGEKIDGIVEYEEMTISREYDEIVMG